MVNIISGHNVLGFFLGLIFGDYIINLSIFDCIEVTRTGSKNSKVVNTGGYPTFTREELLPNKPR